MQTHSPVVEAEVIAERAIAAYVSIRQHTSACVSSGCDSGTRHRGIRQHTSAYVSIRQHTSAYVSIPVVEADIIAERAITCLIPLYYFAGLPVAEQPPREMVARCRFRV